MKSKMGLLLVLFSMLSAYASEEITVKIDSLVNVKGNGAIEACGTAHHKDGIRPLLVTLKHDNSYYTVLTAINDRWCALFKRWTFSGNVEVTAATMDYSHQSEIQVVHLKK